MSSDSKQELIKLLYAHSQQNNTTSIIFSKLVALAQNYAQKFYKERKSLLVLVKNTETTLLPLLENLETENQVQILRNNEGTPQRIRYTGYFKTAIAHWYKKMEQDSSIPFFSNRNLHPAIPSQEYLIVPINIEFSRQWERLIAQPKILQLTFQENLPEILVTPRILARQLLSFCIAKVGKYIHLQQLYIDISSRMNISDSNITNIRKTLDSFVIDPNAELKQIIAGNEQSVSLWGVIHGLMMKNIEKIDLSKLTDQYSYQSIIIIHHLLMHFLETRKEEESQKQLISIGLEKLSQPPYLSTINELQELIVRADHKSPSSEEMAGLITRLTQSTPEKPPLALQLNGPEGHQYVIAQAHIVSFLGTELRHLRKEYRIYYRDRWVRRRTEGVEYPFLSNDAALEMHVENKLHTEASQVYMMLNSIVIEQGLKAFEKNTENVELYEIVINSLNIDGSTILPYREILGLNLEIIRKEAALYLPIWALIPGINSIVRLFRALWKNISTKWKKEPFYNEPTLSRLDPAPSSQNQQNPESSPPTSGASRRTRGLAPSHSPSAQTNSNANIDALLEQTGSLREAEKRLDHLASQWNFLVDKKEQEAFLEDLNALCRDVLRKIWNGHVASVPDFDRIQNLAERVASNRIFERITNIQKFHEYIELHLMVNILQRIKRL